MIQAYILLQSALALLTLISTGGANITPDLRNRANFIANYAIQVATTEIAKQQNLPQSPQVPQNPPVYYPVANPQTEPPKSPLPAQTQSKPMTTLEIFSPIPTKGLNREFKTTSELNANEEYYNELYIGLIVRDADGNSVSNAVVTVVATDTSQNKTINGSGDVTSIYPNGIKTKVYYYPYTYQFKTSGDHTITFSTGGVSEAVTVTVSQ